MGTYKLLRKSRLSGRTYEKGTLVELPTRAGWSLVRAKYAEKVEKAPRGTPVIDVSAPEPTPEPELVPEIQPFVDVEAVTEE